MQQIPSKPYDVLVVGSGIAGLSFALEVACSTCCVGLITKKNKAESNTNYAQGGIAFPGKSPEEVESHIKDTLEAGDGLCDPQVVRSIIEAGTSSVESLMDLGVDFSKEEDGQFSLHLEGGHSQRRVLHVADHTGFSIEEALLKKIEQQSAIEVMEHQVAVDLITTDAPKRVGGLCVLNVKTQQVELLHAPLVFLASGGGGQVYRHSSNPSIATGDGFALAARAGAWLKNMEFIQFHPTCLYGGSGKRFLISEAVRGEGAVLRNEKGEAFMKRYHAQADLAARDTVAWAADCEMKRSGAKHLWLDFTHVCHGREDEMKNRFPSIDLALQARNLDFTKHWVPVVPACHYFCGGVSVDLEGKSSLTGLWACGEVACSGLHGANRLASNSLLEASVVARRCAKALRPYLDKLPPQPWRLDPKSKKILAYWNDPQRTAVREKVLYTHARSNLQAILTDYVGIVRSTQRLLYAREVLLPLKKKVQKYSDHFTPSVALLELRNLVDLALMITDASLKRKESRGLHVLLDCPQKATHARDTVLKPPP